MIDVTDLIGQPFDMQNKAGYNCYGLCCEVCKRMGIMLPDRQPVEDLAERSLVINTNKQDYIKLDSPEPGCLVTFKVRPPYVTHVGVMLDKVRFIHVMKKRQVCIERIDRPFWRDRLDGFYRYVGTPARTS